MQRKQMIKMNILGVSKQADYGNKQHSYTVLTLLDFVISMQAV